MNTISLAKGEGINLSKRVPSLKRIRVGLGWDESRNDPVDLDASAFVCRTLNGEPKLLTEKHFVFYNNYSTPRGSVRHSGDNRTGSTIGDDETITVDTELLEAEINEVSFVVTIHEAISRRHNFGKVSNAYIKLYNDDVPNSPCICEYRLSNDFKTETAVQFGSLLRDKNGDWLFKAVGAGYNNFELGDFVNAYL